MDQLFRAVHTFFDKYLRFERSRFVNICESVNTIRTMFIEFSLDWKYSLCIGTLDQPDFHIGTQFSESLKLCNALERHFILSFICCFLLIYTFSITVFAFSISSQLNNTFPITSSLLFCCIINPMQLYRKCFTVDFLITGCCIFVSTTVGVQTQTRTTCLPLVSFVGSCRCNG